MEGLNDERDQEDLPTNTDLANSFLSLGHEIQVDQKHEWMESDDMGYKRTDSRRGPAIACAP